MSDTTKEGKRGWRGIKTPDTENQKMTRIICARHSFGSTEKILRRNRNLWRRLLGKARRTNDKKVIESQTTED